MKSSSLRNTVGYTSKKDNVLISGLKKVLFDKCPGWSKKRERFKESFFFIFVFLFDAHFYSRRLNVIAPHISCPS